MNTRLFREIWEKRGDGEKRKPHRKRKCCPTLLILNLLTIKYGKRYTIVGSPVKIRFVSENH